MTATSRILEGSAAPVLARMWWAMMLRALAAIAFAFLAFFWLGRSVGGMTTLFAAYAVVDGFLSLLAAIRGGGIVVRSGLSFASLASFAAAIATLVLLDISSPMLAMIIGLWAVVRGGFEFAGALTLRRVMMRDWSLAMIGGLSVAFGILLIIGREMEPWTLVRLTSCYALILGLMMILLALRFRKAPRP